MRLAGVLQLRCWPTDDRTHPNDGRTIDIGLSFEDRCVDRVDIDGSVGQQVGVQRLPAVRLVALQDVFGERDVGVALNRDVVVIVKNDEVAELLCSGQRACFGRDSFFQAAIASDHVDVMVKGALAWCRARVEQAADVPGVHGHADGI